MKIAVCENNKQRTMRLFKHLKKVCGCTMVPYETPEGLAFDIKSGFFFDCVIVSEKLYNEAVKLFKSVDFKGKIIAITTSTNSQFKKSQQISEPFDFFSIRKVIYKN